jgi:iron(III) transport system permease protein
MEILKMRKILSNHYLGAMLLAAGLLLTLGAPLWIVLEGGLKKELFMEIWRNPIYPEGLFNAFAVACGTTVLTFCIALPMAFFYTNYRFRGHGMVQFAVLVPMILPPFVGALGFQHILGHYGVVNTLLVNMGFERIDMLGAGSGRMFAVCLVEALHLFPILFLNLSASLGNADNSCIEAAHNLGIGKIKTFFRIRLPQIMPGIFAGASIVAIWSFTELGTPLMFGVTRITPVQIFNGITELENNPMPYTLVVLMLGISILLYSLAKWLMRGSKNRSGSIKGSASVSIRHLNGLPGMLAGGYFLLITLLAVAPHIALLLAAAGQNWYDSLLPASFSLDNFRSALSDPLVLPSIINSLKYSLLATVFATAAGILTALLAVRWKIRGGKLLDALTMLPLAVPGIVMAIGFLGLADALNWKYFNPLSSPVLFLGAAYAIRRLPYVVRSASAGLEQMPEELEQAGRNLGAGPWRVWCRITLPAITASLLAGIVFAFGFSMLEVSDSLVLAQRAESFPITRAIYELSGNLGSGPGQACAFGVWAMGFLGAVIYAGIKLAGKNSGSVFRF